MIKLQSYRGMQVKEEKTENKSYASTPLFASKDIKVEDVPINKNLNAVSIILQEGDKNPFYFISEMKFGEKHPTVYGEIMTKEWAESFVEKLDNAPFPISAFGHVNMSDPWERKPSDGYVLGGKVDEERESMFLLNYLRNDDESKERQEIFEQTKRELRAGMLSTSISNMQRYVRTYDDAEEKDKWYVVESITGQRNDIVEHDLTGSDAAIVARSFKNAEDESANQTQGEKSMDKKEMLKKLQTLKGNGELSIAEVADTFGLELVTDEHKSAVSSLKAIQDEAGEGVDILTLIKDYKQAKEDAITAQFDKNKESALKEVFKGNEHLIDYATELFTLKTGTKEECEKEAKRVSEMKVLKDFASKIASDMSKGASFKLDNSVGNTGEVVKL